LPLKSQFPLESLEDALEAFGVSDSASASKKKQHRKLPREADRAWTEVHVACSIGQIAQVPDHVLAGGVIAITVVPKNSSAQSRFVEELEENSRGLLPPIEPNQDVQVS